MEFTHLPDGHTPIYDDGTSSLPEFLGSLHEQVYAIARESGNSPKNLKEDIEAFVAAVDWRENWIQGILGFHLVAWVVTVATRRYFLWQATTFFLVCLLVWGSETLNTYAHLNWKAFSTQDYFDLNGFFISVLFAGPLLMLATFQMVNFLWIAAHLLVDVKKQELQKQRNGEACDKTPGRTMKKRV